MITGVVAIIVEAMEVLVYCTAISESDTPTNGPKMAPKKVALIPFLLERDCFRRGSFLRIRKSMKNPIIPVIILI